MSANDRPRIRRGRPNGSFTAISNALIADLSLSPEARLTLIYLLSKFEDWELQIDDIRNLLGRSEKPCGRNKAYEVVKELKTARYVVACQDMDGGRFSRMTYYVFDEPQKDVQEDVRAAHGGQISHHAEVEGLCGNLVPLGNDVGRLPDRQICRSRPCPGIRDASPCPEKRDTEIRDHIKERGKPKTEVRTARGELLRVLDQEHADAVMAHRKALRKPLTTRAAELLAKKFEAFGDANSAADAMILYGWQGFEPAWLERKGGRQNTVLDGNGIRRAKPRTVAEAARARLDQISGEGGEHVDATS